MSVPLWSVGFGGCSVFGGFVWKQQIVRYVFATGGGLLRQVVMPTQDFQDRAYQLLLCGRFVRLIEQVHLVELAGDGIAQLLQNLWIFVQSPAIRPTA